MKKDTAAAAMDVEAITVDNEEAVVREDNNIRI